MLFIALVFGLCFGSFANVIIYRVPIGLSIIKPSSRCPVCEKKIKATELIPVLSWLILRGKCSVCRAKIPTRYPVIEITCALLFAAIFAFSPLDAVIPLVLLVFILLCVSVIDFDTQTIPDGLLIFGASVGVVWVMNGILFPNIAYSSPNLTKAALGIFAGGAPLLLLDKISLFVYGRDGFGYGDVKLMAMVGIFIGWREIFIAFFFAFVLGGLTAIALVVLKKIKRGQYMPFGPFLALGSLISLWFGEIIINAYFGI